MSPGGDSYFLPCTGEVKHTQHI